MKLELIIVILLLMGTTTIIQAQDNEDKPLKIGVVGFTHTHVHWLLGREDRGDIELVGFAEPNKELAMRYIKQHGLDSTLWYPTMEAMVEATQPEAVCAFGTIYAHLEVVEYCAPKGLHVMVEKPLAVSLKHAQKMKSLADQHNIHLLTNYETTWYASHYEAYDKIHKQDKMGEIRKIVVHDGHPGPIEIGCNPEFTDWLTDPVLNGAGALTDFGCYGANLATWLMQNEKPQSVFAVTQQIKPHLYPKVDDEATIVLTYPKAQVIIQASWNWDYNRKDIEIHTVNGHIKADRNNKLEYTEKWDGETQINKIEKLEAPVDDPFAYFQAVVRGTIEPKNDLSSLSNNMIVMEILEAAKKSAKKGKAIQLK